MIEVYKSLIKKRRRNKAPNKAKKVKKIAIVLKAFQPIHLLY